MRPSARLAALVVTSGLVVTSTLVVGSAGWAEPARAAAPVPTAPGWLVTVTVHTVPPLAGVRLRFDRHALSTNARGIASYPGWHNLARHSLTLVDTVVERPGRRYTFVRWAGQRDPEQAFRPTVHGLPLRADYVVTAAFSVDYPVRARFVDQAGHPVPTTLITEATVRSASGDLAQLPVDGAATWLRGGVPSYQDSRLVIADVSYSVQRVVYAGTNAVRAGQQRFQPGRDPIVTVTVPLHSLAITAHDALLPGRRGEAAVVTGPDGRRHNVPFGSDGFARLAGLPRGTYRVDIVRAGGLVMTSQLNLADDRTLDVPVVGWLDLSLLAGALLLVAGGLLLAGHQQLRRRLTARWARRRVAWSRQGG